MATAPLSPLVDATRCSQSDGDFWAVLFCDEVTDPVSASSLVHGASRIATAKATANLRKPSNINSHSLSAACFDSMIDYGMSTARPLTVPLLRSCSAAFA